MPLYATVSDVMDAYEGHISEAQIPWVNGLIERAERLLLARVRSIPTRVTAGTLERVAVADAVVAAVLRVVRNPGGMQSETEGSYLYSVQRDVAGGKLYFTGDDLALVQAGSVGYVPRSVTVTLPDHRIPGGRFLPTGECL